MATNINTGPNTRSKTYANVTGNNTSEGSVGRGTKKMTAPPSTAPHPSPTLANDRAAGPMSTEVPANISQPINMIDSDDDLLLEPAPPRKKSLLILRQEYKKLKLNLNKTRSHLEFIRACLDKETTPRGLQVNVRCNALLADFTDIKERFAGTKQTAENSYTQALLLHYAKLEMKLKKDAEAVTAEMEATSRTVTPEERQQHQEMLTKTDINIQKQQEELTERKKKKLEFLDKPGQGRKERRRKGNYGNNPRNSASHPYKRPTNSNPRQPQHQQKAQNPRHFKPQPNNGSTQVLQPQNPVPMHSAQPNSTDIAGLTNLFANWLKQTNQQAPMQPPTILNNPPCAVGIQHPPLLSNPPCATGTQPPMLHNPVVNPLLGQPPMLFSRGQQGFH